MKVLQVLIIAVAVPLALKSETEIINSAVWTFDVLDGSAVVRGVSPCEGGVVVPSSLCGYPVRTIGHHAFYMKSQLTSVEMQSGVEVIENCAFSSCASLQKVLMPQGLLQIGNSAFAYCSSLKETSIPKSVTGIDSGAFCGCSALETIEIPEGVVSLVDSEFSGCRSLTSLRIPIGVTTIGYYSFGGCASLVSVEIPSTVTSISPYAFIDCPALVRLNVDAENTSYKTVDGCLLSSDGKTLVRGPSKESVVIPNGVEEVGDNAFFGYPALVSVVIPHSVKTIGREAFVGCKSLKTLIIPDSVREIRSGAFYNCQSLDQVEFEGEPPIGVSVASIAAGVFVWYNARYGNQWLEQFAACGLTNVAPYKPASIPYSSVVSVVVTNVNVQYVFNSVRSEFAIPATSDTGFVNIIAEVRGGCVAVPATWANEYPSFVSKYGSDFTKALAMQTGKKDGAGNPMFVWQDYVAGTDPTDETDVFTASITIVDGKVQVSYSPELDDARKALRRYTRWGKEKLTDKDWSVVGEGEEDSFNFFKVTVEMK